MSRYLKADPGVQFRNKRVFTDSGTLTFPGTTTTAKVFVFGGGGNACAAFIVDPCCAPFANQACCCQACIFHHSGAGGGFSEKTYSAVSGLVGCAVVGAAEGTSSFCIPSLGTTSATGGTSAATGSNGCGNCVTPRCTARGVGSGGDINKCGSLGACRISKFCCGSSNNGCLTAIGVMAIPGGAPGFSTGNGTAPTVSATPVLSTCVCCTCCVSGPYGGSHFPRGSINACIFTDLPRGFGACPLETDRYYAYDWDIAGGAKCDTSGSPVGSSISQTVTTSNFVCGGPFVCCCAFITSYTVPSTYGTGPGGITGSGGSGGTGGVGGGGGGVFINEPCIRCICPTNCNSGGTGLVVVYF